MHPTFDVALWPDKKKLRTIYYSIVGIAILAWACHITGSIFWDDYSYMATNFRGQTYPKGWPVTLYWWGMYIGICAPVSAFIVWKMNDTKNPSLAVSKSGLFINQQLIKQTLVPWDNIGRIGYSDSDGTASLSIYFKNPEHIVDVQSGMRKTFVKENLKGEKAFVVEGRFSDGDFDALVQKINEYKGLAK